VTTNRGNYGSSGIGFSSHSDFGFSADTATVILAYWVNTATLNGVSTSIHETQLFAEHEGKMKGIRSMPAFWNSGGGNQMFYRVFTFKEARRRRFRVMMSANCWLASECISPYIRSQNAASPNAPAVLGTRLTTAAASLRRKL